MNIHFGEIIPYEKLTEGDGGYDQITERIYDAIVTLEEKAKENGKR